MELAAILPPYLKWAGGKSWAIARLSELYTDRSVPFKDPFCGALSIPLALQPKTAVLGDINPYLIRLHQWVQRGGARSLQFQNNAEFYLAQRQRFNEQKDDPDLVDWSAEMFYLLNRHCFNGLCRFNSKGQFNVPFGRYDRPLLIDSFSPWSEVMQGWRFQSGHFLSMPIDPGDFLYLDPPYDSVDGKKSFSGYFAPFTWADQVELANWAASHRGPVVIHNHASERAIALYERLGFTVQTVSVKRSISSKITERERAVEVFATRGF